MPLELPLSKKSSKFILQVELILEAEYSCIASQSSHKITKINKTGDARSALFSKLLHRKAESSVYKSGGGAQIKTEMDLRNTRYMSIEVGN